MYYYVYQITNLINGKIYVGKHKSTKHPNENGYYGSGKQISTAIEKYGIENFEKKVLYFCSSDSEASEQEALIVTEDFVRRNDTYNMHKGGTGGWDHYNGTDAHKKSSGRGGKKSVRKMIDLLREHKRNNTEFYQDWHRKVSVANRDKNKNCNGWINHSSSEREQRIKNLSEQARGAGNSQYGKVWISNILTKEVKRQHIDDPIPDGWVRGKKGFVPTKCWINNGVKEKFIFLDQLETFLKQGYTKGRL